MTAVAAWLGSRLAEPSTHAAVAAVIAAATPFIPQPYGMIAAAFFGALGFATKEKA
ncbi:MAG TPA: hypothetical protein VMU87_18150 [Stellaceae bacterium]|nr:hypothetical protein [Stellaceae bacterium]